MKLYNFWKPKLDYEPHYFAITHYIILIKEKRTKTLYIGWMKWALVIEL